MSDIIEEMGGYMGDGSEIEAAMTPQEQPDSQAGDEQTETELDAILNIMLRSGFNSNDLKHKAEAKAKLQAWSRQQTARVLDLLLEQADDHYNGFGKVVPVAAIAALRVGLRTAPYSSPDESAKVQGPQVDTHNEEER